MDYKDGFLAMNHDLDGQIAYAPFEDFPGGNTAEQFFENYHACDTRSEMLAEIEKEAATIFEASSRGYIEDRYDSLDAVPRDRLVRARVFGHGEMHIFDDNGKEDPEIGDDEIAERILTRAAIYADFGIAESLDPGTPEP